jgi:hypothetical protein
MQRFSNPVYLINCSSIQRGVGLFELSSNRMNTNPLFLSPYFLQQKAVIHITY